MCVTAGLHKNLSVFKLYSWKIALVMTSLLGYLLLHLGLATPSLIEVIANCWSHDCDYMFWLERDKTSFTHLTFVCLLTICPPFGLLLISFSLMYVKSYAVYATAHGSHGHAMQIISLLKSFCRQFLCSAMEGREKKKQAISVGDLSFARSLLLAHQE